MDLPGTVGLFNSIGLPSALGYVVAGPEVLGGIGLLAPRFTRLAALGLVLVVVGAVSMHAAKIPGGLANGVPALVLLALLALIMLTRSLRVVVSSSPMIAAATHRLPAVELGNTEI